MTTLDPTQGQTAFRRLHSQVLFSACLLAAAAGPALADAMPAPARPAPTTASMPIVAPPPAQPVITPAPGVATGEAGAPAPGTAPSADILVASAAGTGVVAADAAAEQPTAPPSRIQTVLKHALALLGTPYRWGGTTTAGFDCSGLVGYVFRTTLGIELPRVSRDMARTGKLVDRSHMSPGDLVFFGRKGRVNHVGIYLGDGRFLHAPRTGRDVTVSTMDGGYWGNKFLEARRVAGI